MNLSRDDIVALWKKHLHVERVTDQDNFFELGGDSVQVLRLVYELSTQYSAGMDVRVFFDNPTPAGLLAATASTH
jgi:acyl carrier protein